MDKKLRVAVYCRIGGSPDSTSICAVYYKHYEDLMKRHKNWNLTGMYVDEGAGTKTRSRPELRRLLEDCRQGKIDLIVTKSVSRLYRNVTDLFDCLRALRALDPPVGVYFENEDLFTLGNEKVELLLAFIMHLAEEESRNKSKHTHGSRFWDTEICGEYLQMLAQAEKQYRSDVQKLSRQRRAQMKEESGHV